MPLTLYERARRVARSDAVFLHVLIALMHQRIVETIVHEYRRDEFLHGLAHPFGGRTMVRRYHWQSRGLPGFFESPHAAVEGRNVGTIVNLADVRADEPALHLQLPHRREVLASDVMQDSKIRQASAGLARQS